MEKRPNMKRRSEDVFSRWSVDDAIEEYGLERWSQGIFSANAEGHVCLRTEGGPPEIDLKHLVDSIRKRGLELPVLLRFTDILRQRMRAINNAFRDAIKDHAYGGEFRGVYPIKVNQHRQVLDDILEAGREYHYGLEVGSKPELLIGLTRLDDPEALLVCNGFKDREYVETALAATRLGQRVIIVIEKPREVQLVLEAAKRLEVKPILGIRMKLASRGRGMWESSGGSHSKFGLTASETVDAIRHLKKRKMLHTLQLLHFHLGSQITDIHRIKDALREAMVFFTEVGRLGATVRYIDVGGGLAVDYDGSHTNFASSANYDVREYAADIVDALHTACTDASLPPPTIVTESGRALVAHHSLLVTEAVHATRPCDTLVRPKVTRRDPPILHRMAEILDRFAGKNFQEIYHDIMETRREALLLFSLRQIGLEDRAKTETFFWITCAKVQEYAGGLDYIPDEMEGLDRLLSAIYFCNFSLFQSAPDHWAVKQLFPVAPLHRLEEKPSVRGFLGDVTCDSDGVMDRFVDLRDVRDTLPLHPLRPGEPYYLGIFLLGAYQEILGDLHNLFGDTTVVHVSSDETGYVIDKTLPGDRIQDVLANVHFSKTDLMAHFRKRVESALKQDQITLEESAHLTDRIARAFDHYTYLSSAPISQPRKRAR